MKTVKTAVSLPEPLLRKARLLAENSGISCSGLFALAIREFVSRHRDDIVTSRLNKVYSPAGPDSRLEKGLAAIQYRSLVKNSR